MIDECPHHEPDVDAAAAAVDESTAPARQRLAGLTGKGYWRSLEELSGSTELQSYVQREFPHAASEWMDGPSRRNFLKLMGASLALAGVYGCNDRNEEKIVPYVSTPEKLTPGKPLFFATAMPLAGVARPVIVEQHMGRPTKIEGNPQHPASLGATDAITQAAILSLYDPDRAQVITNAGQISTWPAFRTAIDARLASARANGGAGLRILTERVTSPTLYRQFQQLKGQFPQAKWCQYEPLAGNGSRAGAATVNTVYRFAKAKRILSLDSDFLFELPGSVRYARDFADGRRVREGRTEMNRLYAVQSTPTITSTMADHRLVVRASEVESIAQQILNAVKGQTTTQSDAVWIAAVAKDLVAHKGECVVVAGAYQSEQVHRLAYLLNEALGGIGSTVDFHSPAEASSEDGLTSLKSLVAEMNGSRIDMLVILGGNPAYTAPADVKFADALTNFSNFKNAEGNLANFTAHLSLYGPANDETAFRCQWHIPEAHFLETWCDARAYDGTATVIQPLIAPLYQGRSAHELLFTLLGQSDANPRETVRQTWREALGDSDFEDRWGNALRSGWIEGTTSEPSPFVITPDRPEAAPTPAASGTFEVIFRPDPTVLDGRFANNAWLQELPKPLTKLTWDNAALMSPATASQLRLIDGDDWSKANGQVVKITTSAGSVEAPVWVMAGHPDGCVTLHLGYGRERAGRVGTRAEEPEGFGNANRIRSSSQPWLATGATISAVDREYPLSCTQRHQNMEGRDLIRVTPIDDFDKSDPHRVADGEPDSGKPKTHSLSLYKPYDYSQGHQWGMVIDNNACIGCNACVTACQSENNIPVVGKDQVARGRAMHWLRIDTYFEGDPHTPDLVNAYFEPIPCMHCENAPCEVVCPVAATTHSVEGLNEMTYNRCIGTRYCSNNCPYKVRRFNFLHYADVKTPSLQLAHNPNVTVRARGVMEKCTYCVQRMDNTRISLKTSAVQAQEALSQGHVGTAEALRREMDAMMGSLQTACQQACPTEAITFGDMLWKAANGEALPVAHAKAQPHNYGLLEELNTKPRTTYLDRFVNANPEIPAPARPAPRVEAEG